jgi:hypothetical protein
MLKLAVFAPPACPVGSSRFCASDRLRAHVANLLLETATGRINLRRASLPTLILGHKSARRTGEEGEEHESAGGGAGTPNTERDCRKPMGKMTEPEANLCFTSGQLML